MKLLQGATTKHKAAPAVE